MTSKSYSRSHEHRGSVGLLGFLGAVALLASCGRSEEPRWIDLARGFEPAPMVEAARGWTSGNEDRVLPHDHPADAWIERTLPASLWSASDAQDVFEAPRPRDGAFRASPEGPTRLLVGEHALARRHAAGPPEAGEYTVEAARILLCLGPNEEPVATRFGVRVTSGRSVDGTWRVRGNGRIGSGIPVWNDRSETLITEIPPASELLFVSAWVGGTPGPGDAPLFRVRLDGRVLFEAADASPQAFHRVPLPEDGVKSAQLSFEVEGPPGLGLFLDPELAPLERGDYADRPWEEQRPDIILFLADTFRADNLEIHGGAPNLTPNLNRFARESARFLQARSSASWTLPSIASILTGLHPGQHGAVDEDLALPEAIETLPEALAARGYRTGAITDGGFFSQGFGLDQGFSWFRETSFPAWNVRTTLSDAAAFLDRDDGRPVFLLVHTYRVHAPYRSGPNESLQAWNDMMKEGYRALAERGNDRRTREAVLLSLADPMRELYLEGVHDLDVAFGAFRDSLEERGLLGRARILFTADHGEAFGEHGDMEHGKDLWDVKVHVPLLLRGPGIEARDVGATVSLIDIPATLAPMAGIQPPNADGNPAASLLEAETDRAAYSYLIERARKQLVVTLGAHKVYTLPDAASLRAGKALHAFELDHDPAEERDVAGTASWPAELLRGEAARAERQLEPRAEAHSLGAAARERPDLRQIGYGGE